MKFFLNQSLGCDLENDLLFWDRATERIRVIGFCLVERYKLEDLRELFAGLPTM